MHFSTLIIGACFAAASALASPIMAVQLEEAAHVTDADGKIYELNITGVPNVRVITSDRKDGYYIRPVSYHIAADHVCKFYFESTRGVGGLIGEFTGPVDAGFGADWAAFYECWHVVLAAPREAECGFVIVPDGGLRPLNPTSDPKNVTRFLDTNDEVVNPVIYHVEHCQCDFFVQNSRVGPSPPIPVTGPSINEFGGIYRVWAYNCHFN